MQLISLLVLATIGEAVWETLKMAWQDKKRTVDRIGALVVGILIAFATGVDILSLVNLPSKIPALGLILTGILISRGSNFVHDILASIDNVHIKSKPESTSVPPKQS